MNDRTDIPGIETIKIKRQIVVRGIRCISCGTWECPEYDTDKYEATIIEEATGLCKSCRKAIEWAKERMEGRSSGNENNSIVETQRSNN